MKLSRIAAIIGLFIAVFCCCGCIPHTELDKQAIVEAVGIDKKDDKYEVSVQYFSMEGSGGSTLVDSTKANVIIVRGEGSDIYTALESASAKCGKPLMFGITGIIVFGKDAASEDLLNALSFAETYYQNNPRLIIAVAEDKASDIIDVKFKEENVSANHLQALLVNAEKMGLCERKQLFTVLNELRQPTESTCLPLIGVRETGTDATDDGKTVEVIGGALFSEKKLVSFVSLSAASGLQLLHDRMRSTSISTETEGVSIGVTLYDINSYIDPSFSDGKLRFNVRIKGNGKYTDSQLPDKGITHSSEIEKKCASFIEERIKNAVTSSFYSFGCDPCGLKYHISSNDYTDWIKIKEDYKKYLEKAEFAVSCDINIDRFGIAH